MPLNPENVWDFDPNDVPSLEDILRNMEENAAANKDKDKDRSVYAHGYSWCDFQGAVTLSHVRLAEPGSFGAGHLLLLLPDPWLLAGDDLGRDEF